jgi:hypothetical protein
MLVRMDAAAAGVLTGGDGYPKYRFGFLSSKPPGLLGCAWR